MGLSRKINFYIKNPVFVMTINSFLKFLKHILVVCYLKKVIYFSQLKKNLLYLYYVSLFIPNVTHEMPILLSVMKFDFFISVPSPTPNPRNQLLVLQIFPLASWLSISSMCALIIIIFFFLLHRFYLFFFIQIFSVEHNPFL